MFGTSQVILALTAAVILTGAIAVQAETGQAEKSTGGVTPTAAARQAEQERKLAEATAMSKTLLLLMDTDKNGKVSKQEWMKFMEEEFDRMDVNHDGQLDVKELTQSRMRYRPSIGK
ncbi:MAG: EF-hand domain-containing protein [Terriglobales bacterium]|jgi:uncharacterized membrane protein YdfJ with MMPL/SSD domain